MIEDLVDVLDRSWTTLEREIGPQFALSCFPFHHQLARDARTAGLLADLRREESASRKQLRDAMDIARTDMGPIVDELAATNAEAFEPPPDEDHEYDASLDAVRARLRPPKIAEEDDVWGIGRETNDDDNMGGAVAIVRHVAERAKRTDLVERVDGVVRLREHARRSRRTFFRTSAASALIRWERDLGDLHPPAVIEEWKVDIGRFGRTRSAGLGGIYEQLFGDIHGRQNSAVEERAVEAKLDEMRRDVRRVYEEIRRRIGTERSLLAVFERYRQRCQWYDAERLQALAESGRGKAEDRLTETLAAYLFDHGLNPLTRPLAGQIQPDVLGSDERFSFYVEAKQHDDSANSYLLKGMQQVWDMLDQIRGTRFDVAEAFYVIYRRGGPRYSFPARVQHNERVVHILVIDIAPTAQRGSNAPSTITFNLQQVMPQAAAGA